MCNMHSLFGQEGRKTDKIRGIYCGIGTCCVLCTAGGEEKKTRRVFLSSSSSPCKCKQEDEAGYNRPFLFALLGTGDWPPLFRFFLSLVSAFSSAINQVVLKARRRRKRENFNEVKAFFFFFPFSFCSHKLRSFRPRRRFSRFFLPLLFSPRTHRALP